MEATDEQVKKFCEVCKKEKDADKCIDIDGKTVCCNDCLKDKSEDQKKPAICEFC